MALSLPALSLSSGKFQDQPTTHISSSSTKLETPVKSSAQVSSSLHHHQLSSTLHHHLVFFSLNHHHLVFFSPHHHLLISLHHHLVSSFLHHHLLSSFLHHHLVSSSNTALTATSPIYPSTSFREKYPPLSATSSPCPGSKTSNLPLSPHLLSCSTLTSTTAALQTCSTSRRILGFYKKCAATITDPHHTITTISMFVYRYIYFVG